MFFKNLFNTVFTFFADKISFHFMSAVSGWEPCGTIIPRKTRKHSHNVKLISVEKVLPNSKQKDLNLNTNCQIIYFCLHFIFQTLFRASYLNDKHPVIFMKDVDFDNLKALVEYMYKGQANVPQHMLQSFIRYF